MEWYYIVLIILSIILFIVLFVSFICFRLTFYSKNKGTNTNEIKLPDNFIYKKYEDIICADINEVRTYPYKEYSIKSFDGLTLYAKYYERFPGAPIEIMFHGYRGTAERDLSTGIKRAFRCGRNALLVDQRGSGKSEGHVLTFGINERHDCVSWAKFASKEFGENTKLIITGISMGAATVLMASVLDLPKNVIGVLSDCGYNNPSDIIKKVIKDIKLSPKIFYPFIKLGARIYGKFNLEETSPYECVQKTKLPTIFFHGDNDNLVPCDMSIKLYNACASEKKIVTIKGAEHGVSYLADPDKYVEELNSFFKNE